MIITPYSRHSTIPHIMEYGSLLYMVISYINGEMVIIMGWYVMELYEMDHHYIIIIIKIDDSSIMIK